MRNGYEVGLWKTIRKDWDLFNSKAFYSISNERKGKFWKDKWRCNEPLCISFPSYCALALLKEK